MAVGVCFKNMFVIDVKNLSLVWLTKASSEARLDRCSKKEFPLNAERNGNHIGTSVGVMNGNVQRCRY